jgi:UDP-N-acetylglucosamine diphosphorylase/glucosamine-1-phosphate N-acetyltransferase
LIALIIMAAGKGTRMKSELPKVLHEIAGKPMLLHVLETAGKLNPQKVVVILGHGRELVSQVIEYTGVEIVVQNPPLGTGHAVMQAEVALNGFIGDVVILSGDVPLLTAESLRRLVEHHRESKAAITVASTIAPNPFGYGRIVRDQQGRFLRIVEEKDATDREREIDEINSGIYCVRYQALFSALHRTRNENAKGEYYLTDAISILRDDGETVEAVKIADFAEVQGINTQEDLNAAEKAFSDRVI